MGTLKQWVEARVAEGAFTIKDILSHGCVAGWPHLTYHSDTCKLYDQYDYDIWNLVNEGAEQCGQTAMEFIAGWNHKAASDDSFKNNLVWFAVEEICQQLDHDQDLAAGAGQKQE